MKLINRIKCFFKGHVRHTGTPAISLSWGQKIEDRVQVSLDWCVRCSTLFGWEQEKPIIIDVLPHLSVPNPGYGIGGLPKLADLIAQEKYSLPSSFDMDFLSNNVILKLKVKRATQEENSDLGPNDFDIKNAQNKISKWTIENCEQAAETYNEICHTLDAISNPVEITLRDNLFDQLDFFRPNGTKPKISFNYPLPAAPYIKYTDVTFKIEQNENSNTSGTVPTESKPK